MKLSRDIYLPTNVPVTTDHPAGTDLEVHTYTSTSGSFCLLVFKGKAVKPIVHTSYPTAVRRDESLAHLVAGTMDALREKAQRKANEATEAAALLATIKVGDIWSCSWGYDQTNVDFYVVVKVTGKMVHLREIASRSTGDSSVAPDPTRFVSSEIHARKVVHGGCSLKSYMWAHPFSGGSTYQTPANAGH